MAFLRSSKIRHTNTLRENRVHGEVCSEREQELEAKTESLRKACERQDDLKADKLRLVKENHDLKEESHQNLKMIKTQTEEYGKLFKDYQKLLDKERDLRGQVAKLKVELHKDTEEKPTIKVMNFTIPQQDWISIDPKADEIWRVPEGDVGEKYEVSSRGRVRGNNRMNRGKCLKTYRRANGMVYVRPVVRGAQMEFDVAVLMGLAKFNGSPEGLNLIAVNSHVEAQSGGQQKAVKKSTKIVVKRAVKKKAVKKKVVKKAVKNGKDVIPRTSRKVTDPEWAFEYRISRDTDEVWKERHTEEYAGVDGTFKVRKYGRLKLKVAPERKGSKLRGVKLPVIGQKGKRFYSLERLRKKAGY